MVSAWEPDELRGSRPVLGGAEGEIPSVYSTLKNRCFSSSRMRRIFEEFRRFVNRKNEAILGVSVCIYLAGRTDPKNLSNVAPQLRLTISPPPLCITAWLRK